MRRAGGVVVLLACLLCGACAGSAGPGDGPEAAVLAGLLNAAVADPARAGWLLEPDLARAEAISCPAPLTVRILQRKPTGVPTRLVLRVRISGELQVVQPPPMPDEVHGRLGRPGVDAAGRAAILTEARTRAAKQVPAGQRTITVPYDRITLIQVEHDAGTWRLVLPIHLATGQGMSP
jgi:hypothetical protein